MKLLQRIPFSFEDRNYEIRILSGDNTINVVAFHNNYPVNGFRHYIKLPQKYNPQKLLNTDILNEIVCISQDDIIKRRWEKVVNILK